MRSETTLNSEVFHPVLARLTEPTQRKLSMSLKQKLFKPSIRFIKAGLRITGATGAKLSAALSEELIPTAPVETKYGTIHFFCPGRIPLFRAETFKTKEPETIEWIDSFKKNSVFWDIGANVGIYSL